MRDISPTKWTIAGVSVAAAALGGVGVAALGGTDPEPAEADAIALEDRASVRSVGDPVSVDAPADDVSPDGESLDSPLQSADDSPPGADSVDTPGDHPDSVDSPEPALAPRDTSAPAQQRDHSVDSPDSHQSPADDDGAASVDTP